MFSFPIYVFSFWEESNKSKINLQATLTWSTKTINQTISLDIRKQTKLRKTITPPATRRQMKFLLSVLQCISLCLKNQTKDTFKFASSAIFFMINYLSGHEKCKFPLTDS